MVGARGHGRGQALGSESRVGLSASQDWVGQEGDEGGADGPYGHQEHRGGGDRGCGPAHVVAPPRTVSPAAWPRGVWVRGRGEALLNACCMLHAHTACCILYAYCMRMQESRESTASEGRGPLHMLHVHVYSACHMPHVLHVYMPYEERREDLTASEGTGPQVAIAAVVVRRLARRPRGHMLAFLPTRPRSLWPTLRHRLRRSAAWTIARHVDGLAIEHAPKRRLLRWHVAGDGGDAVHHIGVRDVVPYLLGGPGEVALRRGCA